MKHQESPFPQAWDLGNRHMQTCAACVGDKYQREKFVINSPEKSPDFTFLQPGDINVTRSFGFQVYGRHIVGKLIADKDRKVCGS